MSSAQTTSAHPTPRKLCCVPFKACTWRPCLRHYFTVPWHVPRCIGAQEKRFWLCPPSLRASVRSLVEGGSLTDQRGPGTGSPERKLPTEPDCDELKCFEPRLKALHIRRYQKILVITDTQRVPALKAPVMQVKLTLLLHAS
ncbi:hypothetical protein NDU88_007309 [Pleurodeles waltl]|uniref:Uncharacterized protein n=1 Tax=Pleurodeles waltl TaxID=8319 RepID=A0AAV7MIS5_PLEWA|nr:hypothetical protein NDU88_007309 [Pleurodeles waltl]